MAAKNRTKAVQPGRRSKSQKEPISWSKLLLMLSLVPLVIGVLIIGAWALDFDLWGAPADQITVGTFFVLFSFTATNALQRKWKLAGGWLLLLVADWLVLTGMQVWIQIAAAVLGLFGLGLIALEFFQRYKSQKRA